MRAHVRYHHIVAIASAISGAWSASSAEAYTSDCGHRAVRIEGSAIDTQRGCDALAEVMSAFARMDLHFEPAFTLVFRDQVVVEFFENPEDSASSKQLTQVSGFFDAHRNLIEATSFDSDRPRDRHPWGLDWSPEIALSVVHHELAHMATFAILGEDYWRLGRAWLEFIAYAIEFELMDASLKNAILTNNPGIKAFDGPLQVNPMLHAVDPDRFGLRSYMMAEANGGMEFIRRVIVGEVSFSRSEVLWRR